MGCTSSKLDDLPAVALCRERCTYLDEAIHLRYALSEAHLAYLHSLTTVGITLHRFFDRDLESSFMAEPASPVLNLPAQRKIVDPELPSSSGSPKKAAAAINHHHHHHNHSHSNSGSHLKFHSDSEEEDDDDDDDSASGSLHHHHDHSEDSSPVHHFGGGHISYADNTENFGQFPGSYPGGQQFPGSYPGGQQFPGSYPSGQQFPGSYPVGGGGGFMHMNYMRKQTTQSVTYRQRPMNPEIVQMSEAEASSSSYLPYNNQSSNFYSPPYYNNYDNFRGGFPGASPSGMMPSYYGSSYPPPPGGIGTSSSAAAASTSKEPPPPPPPPSSSGWDFLNPFESFETYYPPYTPSRDSREVREEEGIPDLEEEDYQHEVVKEVHVDQKFVVDSGGGSSARASYSKAAAHEDEKEENSETLYRARPNVAVESDPMEYEVHMVDKKVVGDEDGSGVRGNAAGFKARGGLKGDPEVVKEIQVQFERASQSGDELAKILEVGKLPHNRKHAAYQVSSKMLHAITPSMSLVSSQPSTSKASNIEKVGLASLDVEGDLNLRSRNLSSTLHKLYLWEKKLYEEVKVEEKMRVLHERKIQKLKRLDEKGAETHKVDATRALVRSLSTNIRIAIQVVDKISVKINSLRDDELWPQLNEFLQGLIRMWKSMLECHHNQCQAIGEAKMLDAIASRKSFSDAHVEATSQLGHEVMNWTVRFSCWVSAQKGYVRALNNWLIKCLLYVPEETPDGIAPFSPGRIGAPPIFVICNQWSQSLERISEKEVIASMREFARSVLHLWEQDRLEMRQRMTAGKDMERKVKNLEREDQKIQKEIQTLDKKMLLVSGDDNAFALSGQVVYQSDTSKSGSLQVNLHRIFEAMERFTANSLKVYEELLQRIEEDHLARQPEKVS